MADVEVRSNLTNTVVRLSGDFLEIERLGGFSQVHRKGTKRIPVRSITAVQLKMPAFLSAGFIQFSIPGGNESTARGRVPTEAARDENSVLFTKEDQAGFLGLRDAVQAAVAEATRPSAAPAAASVADELIKLAQLRDAGVLSPSEFETQKARLLNG